MLLAPFAAAADEANAVIGGQLYAGHCLVCHGPEGRSKGPLANKRKLDPADLTADRYQGKSLGELVKIIAGYQRMSDDPTMMPNWGVALREEELRDIAAYVLKLTEADVRLRGDTRRGRVIYQRSCAACHGRFGAGDGLLAALIRVDMFDFGKKEDMAKLTDAKLLDVIRNGSGKYMPGWRGVLSDHEILDVAAYIRLLVQ